MHAIIDFLKDAVTRGPSSGVNGCYVAKSGSIYCRNMALQAGVEFESEVPFAVPAEELDAALKRMKEISSLTIDENTVTIKAGRLKSTIKVSHDEAQPMPELPTSWTPYPAGLNAALELAKPFVGDRPGTQGIRLMNDRVTGMSASAGIDITVKGLELEGQYLLPLEAATFLVDRGEPSEYAYDEGAFMFKWSEGGWLRTQLLNDKFPSELVEKIFVSAGTKTPVKITEQWREGVADIVALCDEVFRIGPAGFQGNRGAATYDIEIATGVKGESSWNSKFMAPIFACATSWAPESYPGVTLFKGDNIRGVVIGYRK